MIIKLIGTWIQIFIAFECLQLSVGKVLYDVCMSNVGKEFVVLVADNTRSVNNPRLYLSTPYVTTVNVHIETPLANIVNVDVAVSYGNETVVEIPLDVAIIDTTKSNQTIHVVADDFIVLFSSNIQNNGGDAYMIFPIEVLGTEYVTVNLESKKDDYDSVISMVALKDNTVINVTLSFGLTLVYDGKNYGNETLLSLVLNKYEAFQIAHQGDLSGTILSSSSVVAVFSGHELGQPHISTQSSIDTLYEMLIPVQYWSTFYVIVTNPVFVSGDGEEVSIFASEENTAVTINIMGTPSQVVIDGKGQFHRFHLQCNTSGFIQSDKPVLVSQVTAADQLSTTSNGDSYMVLTTPVNSWVNEYTFSTPGRLDSDSFVHGLVLISHIVSVDNIVLDNNTLNSLYQWREIYDTDFSYTNIKLSEGVHSLTCVDGPRRCWGYVYGIHSLDGYGTSIGRSFVNYQELQDISFKGVERHVSSLMKVDSAYPNAVPINSIVTRSLVGCFVTCALYSCSVVAFNNMTNTCDIFLHEAVCDSLKDGSNFNIYVLQ